VSLNTLQIVNKIIQNNEFYQKKYGCKSFDNFENVPFLEKKEILADQASNPPFGKILNCSLDEIIRVHKTSGTTQNPLLIPLTVSDENEYLLNNSRYGSFFEN